MRLDELHEAGDLARRSSEPRPICDFCTDCGELLGGEVGGVMVPADLTCSMRGRDPEACAARAAARRSRSRRKRR